MKHLIITLLTTIALLSCKTNTDGFYINGYIEGITDSTLITIYDIDQQINLDSAYSINGKFELRGKVKYPSAHWICCNNETITIRLENVEMTFTSSVPDIQSNSVTTGGKEQHLQNELNKLQQPYDLIYQNAYDSLVNEKYSGDEEKKSLIKKFNESQSASHEIYIDFGKKHSDSHMGLNILYMNRESINKDTLKTIYENLPNSIKTTPTANSLKVSLFEEAVNVGDSFIDFEINTIDNQRFKLSSLKGNYIYLYFWEPGCGACRMENQYISEHLNEVPEDLSIVGFSISKNIEHWKKASETDHITWHNVSDKEGKKGKVKTQYQVQAIPTAFLIDKNGTVVKKFKGFNPKGDLIMKIKELISKAE